MQVELVLNEQTVAHLRNNLGEGRVTVLHDPKDGYLYVSFEVKGITDVLSIIHAGRDQGIEIAMEAKSRVA